MAEALSDFAGKVKPEVVEIQGIEFKVREFDMRTRALWLDIVNQYELEDLQYEIQSQIVPKISGMATDIESDPRVKSVMARYEKLEEKHDDLMDLFLTPDEPEDIDEQLNDLIRRMEEQKAVINEVTERVQNEVFEEARNAESKVGEFMEVQDKARIYFVWRLSSDSGDTELGFDEFFDACNGSDYEAAEKLVTEGNARWASLYTNRMQKKPESRKSLN